MKIWVLPLLTLQAAAFPNAAWESSSESSAAAHRRQHLNSRASFDLTAQAVSTSGEHAFVAPASTDQRGPCPGLNALANHGYLPHNGVGTIQQFIDATTQVYGMGADLATFLAIYGAFISGDLLTWSIGGPEPMSLVNPLAGLLEQPQGISYSHNKYEGDASPTRGDLYISQNDYELIMDNFMELYAYQATESEATSNYDIDILTNYRAVRFQNSVSTNPYFFYGPFTGTLANPATYTFMFRFMANKSAEYPEGRLSQDNLKSFMGITGDEPSTFVYKPGYERIPDNWYRRAIGDEYGFVPYFKDVIEAGIAHPEFLNTGGNTGKTNTFTGLSLQNLTGGLYNVDTLAQGDNLACFSFQLLQQALPDLVKGVLADIVTALDMLSSEIATILEGLGCSQLAGGTYGQFEEAFQQFPGFTELKSNGKY